MRIHAIRHIDWLIMTFILLTAAFLRFWESDIVEFFHDDAMLATLAQEIVTGDQWHWTGIISSTGIPNSPMSVYVLLPAFVLSLHPRLAICFIMLWNVVGVALLWKITQRYFGRWAAFFAGMTYAVSPWAVLYSRKLWAQEYHTPFILFGLLMGLYGFLEAPEKSEHNHWLTRHEWAQVLCLPLLLIGMQIHFAAWALLPLYFVLLWIGRKRISRRALFLSAVLCGLVMLPFGIGLSQTLQADPTRITDAAARSDIQTGLSFSAKSIQSIFYLITGSGMETWIAPKQTEALLTQAPSPPLWLILIICLMMGIFAVWRKHGYRITLFLLLWAFLPPLALVPNWTPVYPHYFIACIPAYMLLIGIGANRIIQFLSGQPSATPDNAGRTYPVPTSHVILIMSFMVFMGGIWLTQIVWWRGALDYIATHQIEYPGFTTPLRYLNPIYDTLKAENDVIVLSSGMAWNLNHESVVWSVLLRGDVACVRTLTGDGYAVLPQNDFAVLVAPNAPENPVNNFYVHDDSLHFPERPGGDEYVLYRWQSAPKWIETITPINTVHFDNGVQLIGYALSADKITLGWQLPDGKRGHNYQYSIQIFDASDNRVAQQDKVFWQGEHWCAGDTLFTWTALSVPENAAILQVGMYQLAGSGQYLNANILDAAGAPAGYFARIALEQIDSQ